VRKLMLLIFALFMLAPFTGLGQPAKVTQPKPAQAWQTTLAPIMRFNASLKLADQEKNCKVTETVKAATLYVDTTGWIPLPSLPIRDSLLMALVFRSNLDTASVSFTVQYGVGSYPDSSVTEANAFLGAGNMPASTFVVARKTTDTYPRTNSAWLLLRAAPPGATHVRALASFQASGQSGFKNGTQNDFYEIGFGWPKLE